MKFIIIMLLATSCLNNVRPEDFKKATELCEKNEGLLYFTVYGGHLKVHCNNTATFKTNRD